MEVKVVNGLRRSDFGEVLAQQNDGDKIKWILVRYQDAAVIITSHPWARAFLDNKVIPGSVSIRFGKRVTYKTDPDNGQRIKDDSGKFVTEETDEWGWTMIGCNYFEQLKAEKELEAQVDALEVDKEIIVEEKVASLWKVKAETAKYRHLSVEFQAAVKKQLALIPEEPDEEEDVDTIAHLKNSTEPAAAAAGQPAEQPAAS